VKRAAHPTTCVFHFLFKFLCVLVYFIGRYWYGNYVNTFIFCVILLSFDFWTVKNVTGRLLVGLRWWNDIQEDGSSKWVFESLIDEGRLDAIDKNIFWMVNYVWPFFWVVLFIFNLISFNFSWVLLMGLGVALSMANLVGYYWCSKDQQKRIKESLQQTALNSFALNRL